MDNIITKETFENYQKEQERLNEYLLKLIDIGLSLDRENEVIESTWGETFIDFNIEEKGISLHFEYPDHDNCYGFIPYEAIGSEEQFKKWILDSIVKKHEKEERIKQLKKEAEEARKRAKQEQENKGNKGNKENKYRQLIEELGILEYQRYANIELYKYDVNSENIKKLDKLIEQKQKEITELIGE